MIMDALSPEALALLPQMREWVTDCVWADVYEPEDVAEFTDVQILRGVQRFYAGGIDAFVRDAQPVKAGAL